MIREVTMLSGATWYRAIAITATGKMFFETFKSKQNAEAWLDSVNGK